MYDFRQQKEEIILMNALKIDTSNIYRKVYNQVDKVIAFVYAKKRCAEYRSEGKSNSKIEGEIEMIRNREHDEWSMHLHRDLCEELKKVEHVRKLEWCPFCLSSIPC